MTPCPTPQTLDKRDRRRALILADTYLAHLQNMQGPFRTLAQAQDALDQQASVLAIAIRRAHDQQHPGAGSIDVSAAAVTLAALSLRLLIDFPVPVPAP